MAKLKFVHPPIDFVKMNEERIKSEFKSPPKIKLFERDG